jgi:hypothetical protein
MTRVQFPDGEWQEVPAGGVALVGTATATVQVTLPGTTEPHTFLLEVPPTGWLTVRVTSATALVWCSLDRVNWSVLLLWRPTVPPTRLKPLGRAHDRPGISE